jgi:hypothetical protein
MIQRRESVAREGQGEGELRAHECLIGCGCGSAALSLCG